MQNTEHEENFNAYTQTVFFPCKVLYSYIKQLHIPLDSCRPILHCVKKKIRRFQYIQLHTQFYSLSKGSICKLSSQFYCLSSH